MMYRSTRLQLSAARAWSSLTRACAVAALLGATATAAAGDPPGGAQVPVTAKAQGTEDVNNIWKDPIFQKQFVASYGINAEIEPRISAEEVAILEKIKPLMSTDLAKAEAELRKQLKPKSSAILDVTLAGILFQQDRLKDALDCYNTAVGKFPSFRRAWRNLGLIHARNSEFGEAIRSFTRMIELGGGDSYAFGLLGAAYAAKQDYQPAEAAYRNALLLQPDNTDWRLGLTRCVFKQNKFEDAASLLDALITRYPEKADFWLLQAHAFLGLKQPFKAAGNFEVVDRLGKGTIDSMHTLGDIYVTENLMDLAGRAYERAFDVDTKQPLSRPIRSAELLAARGAASQARRLVLHIRGWRNNQLDEQEKKKLLKLEAKLSAAEGSGSAETVAILEEIVKLDPLDGDALMMLGQTYSRQNEPDRAIQYYERAESLEAFEPVAKVRHALVLVGLNRYAEALPLLRRAQEIKPREDVARLIEQVERGAKTRR